MSNTTPDNIRILLFEGNAVEIDLVVEYLDLSRLSFEIVTAKCLTEGIKLIKDQDFDVILLDLSLPDSSGIDTLKSVGAETEDEVVIILTGSEDEELPLEALKFGAQDYLHRDRLSGEVLRRSIRYALERNNLVNKLKANNENMECRESLLRQIFDANTDAMLILTRKYEIHSLNPAAANLLNAKSDKLVGEIFPFEVNSSEVTELEVPDADNDIRIVELSAVDLIWEGQSTLLVILRDITQSREAELHLKREKERFAVTLDLIADAVIATDKCGAIERLNAEATKVTGIENNDAAGKPLGQVFKLQHPKTGKLLSDPTKALMEPDLEKVSTKIGLSLEAANGQILQVTAATRCIFDDEGRHHGCVTVLRHITQQVEAEDELLKAEKLSSISLLAGGIAHDFNNMLTTILGNISMVRIDLDRKDKNSSRLIAAEKATLQAKSLTQQLLTFSKGGTPLLEEATISEMVDECAQFILRGSNVKCTVERDDDLWTVKADKGQISQVVNNLIINANQAMPEGGTIEIRMRNLRVLHAEVPALDSGDYVCIAVKDNGSGIAPENLERIFNPYFTTKKDGNGLGLASSYSIINRHKGTITADSTVGTGSVLRVYLPKSHSPIDETKPVTTKVRDTPVRETIHRGKGRILVMDDMEAMMIVAGEILTLLGYEVEYSTDGEEAIHAYKTAKDTGNPFDAVVFDLTVPGGMGGEEAADILKQYDPKLIAIASSGYSTSNLMSDYKNSSFNAVVPKPYRIKEMGDALHNVLSTG